MSTYLLIALEVSISNTQSVDTGETYTAPKQGKMNFQSMRRKGPERIERKNEIKLITF